MAKTAQRRRATTQKFIEIESIEDDVIIISGGNACLIIEVTATNFSLLSKDEQDTKIFSYASLLNSLSFPIQIIIKNKPVDIAHYLLDIEAQIKQARNEGVAAYITQYHGFIQQMIQVNTILDKRFYIVIPYTSLESGAAAAVKQDNLFAQAKASLQSKAESLLAQIARLSLRAKILEKPELVKLFYELYNHTVDQAVKIEEAAGHPVVQGAKQK